MPLPLLEGCTTPLRDEMLAIGPGENVCPSQITSRCCGKCEHCSFRDAEAQRKAHAEATALLLVSFAKVRLSKLA